MLKDFNPEQKFQFKVDRMTVTGWVNILKERSLQGRFGFNIYRGRRLIVPFQKIGVRDHPTHANIFGHIYLPRDFPVSFTKNKVEVQRQVFKELAHKIDEITVIHRRISARMAQERVQPVSTKTMSSIEKSLSILERAIPKSQLLKDLLPPEEPRRALPKDADGHGPVESEKRKPRVNPSNLRPVPKEIRARNPRQDKQEKISWYIKLPSGHIKIIHEFVEAEGDPPKMYFTEYYENKHPPEFVVSTNRKFDAWGTTKDEAFYATGNIIAGLSRLIEGLSANRTITPLEIQEEIWRAWGKEFHDYLLSSTTEL